MNDQQQQALSAGLKALAERSRNASASPRVEQAIIAEMERGRWMTGRLKPMTGRLKPASTALKPASTALKPASASRFAALAAALVLVVAGALWIARFERPADREVVRPFGFVALPNAGILPEMESASIVRISLSVSSLPDYGMAIVPEMSADSVEAELLVAQDGQPHAIRLVHDSSQRSRP